MPSTFKNTTRGGRISGWICVSMAYVILSGCGQSGLTQQPDTLDNKAVEEAVSLGLPIRASIDRTLEPVKVDVFQGNGDLLCCLTIGEVHEALAERNVVQTRRDGSRILITAVSDSGGDNWQRMELSFALMDTGGYGLMNITQDGFRTYTMGGSVRNDLGDTNQFIISAFPNLHWDEAYSRERAAKAEEERRIRTEKAQKETADYVSRVRKTVMDCRKKARAQTSDSGEAFRLQEECIRASGP